MTAHKLRLYRAAATDFTSLDVAAVLAEEVNAVATSTSAVEGYARDPLALTHVLTQVLPAEPYVVCLGAGGAGTALLLALHQSQITGLTGVGNASGAAPSGVRAVFADTDPQALDAMRAVADRAGIATGHLTFALVNHPADCDKLIAAAPDSAVVINATGLGKDAAGSPVTDQVPFAKDMLAWDLNYRGDLRFLDQAKTCGIRTVDGWAYFIAGWTSALAAIAGIPLTRTLLDDFARVAQR
ncbi:hypothetical protein [Kribbella hippodromi]|uniref:hypothetical protein n=1 Tax=Kribbella hippodromi TaxID=434347 RepID=UPI0031CEF295